MEPCPTPKRQKRLMPQPKVLPGPRSLQELYQWPERTWKSFADHEKAKFAENWQSGIKLRTQYSGMGCAEQVLILAMHKLQVCFGIDGDLEVAEQCDVAPLCREVLLAFPAPHKAHHVTGDIMDRLPDKVRKKLLALEWPVRPNKPITKGGNVMAQYAERMREWESNVGTAVAMAKAILNAYELMCFRPGYLSRCYRHNFHCPLFDPPDMDDNRLELTVTGTTCLDWSYMGERLGVGGPSMLPFIVWLAEQKARRVPALLHECTVGFRNDLLKEELSTDEYEFHDLVVSPEHLGIPSDRPRLFTLALRRDKYHLDKDFKKFLDFARRKRMIDANVYYVASADIVRAEILERANMSRVYEAPGSQLTWHDVLSPGQRVRLAGYRERVHEQALRNHSDDSSGSAAHSILHGTDVKEQTQPFIFDLEQTAGGCPRMGTVMPCLLRRGEMWNDNSTVNRGLCKEEVLSIAGVWSLPEHGVDIPCPFGSLLRRGGYKELSICDCKRLAGNCINLNVTGTMVMWIMAHINKRRPADPLADSTLHMMFMEDPEEIA